MKPLSERYIYTPMFIAALFIIARTWKQPKGPHRCMDKETVLYTYKTYICFFNTHTHKKYKKKGILPFATT